MANYATINPIGVNLASNSDVTLSDGNLKAVYVADYTAELTMAKLTSGKWYWEVKLLTAASGSTGVLTGQYYGSADRSANLNSTGIYYYNPGNGQSMKDGSGTAYGSATSLNDILQVALDLDNNKIYWGINNTWQNSGDPAAGSNAAYTLAPSTELSYTPVIGYGAACTMELNCGQRVTGLAYTPPTGFNQLKVSSFTAPTIPRPSDLFVPTRYVGTAQGQRVGDFLPFEDTYDVEFSCLLGEASSQYLTRTPSATTNRRTGTFSAWVKRGSIDKSNQQVLWSATTDISSSDYCSFELTSSGNPGGSVKNAFMFESYVGSTTWNVHTTNEFSSTTEWYHVVMRMDTTQSTEADRIRIYVNGVQQTLIEVNSGFPDQDTDYFWNVVDIPTYIGRYGDGSKYFDGQMCQIAWCDGQSYGPDSFGETDTSSQKWVPKDISGLTFGNNGFYLNQGTDGIMGRDASVTSGSAISATHRGNYNDADNSSPATSWTKSSAALGTANSDRYVIVAASSMYKHASAIAVSSVTIGGVSATKVTSGQGSNGGSGSGMYRTFVEYWKANVPTGTTGDIVMVTATGVEFVSFDWWTCVGDVVAEYVTDQSVDTGSGFGTLSMDQQCPDNGFVTAFLIGQSDSTTTGNYTWTGTGLTEVSSVGWTGSSHGVDGGTTAASGDYTAGDINAFTVDDDNGSTHYYTWLVVAWVPAVSYLNSYSPANFFTNNMNQLYDSPSHNFPMKWNPEDGGGTWTPTLGSLSTWATSDGQGRGNFYFDVTDWDGYYFEYSQEVYKSRTYLGIATELADQHPSGQTSSYYKVSFGADRYVQALGSASYWGEGTWETDNTIIGVHVFRNRVAFYVDGTIQETDGVPPECGDLTGGSSGTGGGGTKWWTCRMFNPQATAGGQIIINTGQHRYLSGGATTWREDAGGYFKYAPPTGAKALQSDKMQTFGDDVAITSFNWIKNLDATTDHIQSDVVREVTKYLSLPTTTGGQSTDAEAVQQFLPKGVSIGTMAAINPDPGTSAEGDRVISYNWGATGTVATDSTGMVKTSDSSTSSINRAASTTSGFSAITYTGNGAYSTIKHGLGVAPQFFIIRDTGANGVWKVWHHSYADPLQGYMTLDSDAAEYDFGDDRIWGGAPSTSTTIGVGNHIYVNASSDTYVAWVWAPVEGFSSFGGFTGNSSTDGPFIYTGFRPAFVMVKKLNGTGNWGMTDMAQNPENLVNHYVLADTTGVQATDGSSGLWDYCASGFKIRGNGGMINGSNTYIYAAWAEFPFGGSGVSQGKAR